MTDEKIDIENVDMLTTVGTPVVADGGEHATVAVVIPTFNDAHFLPDALSSVLAQTRAADQIVVVDDGSAEDPAPVIARFPGVTLIRQRNAGLSAARNTGLRACSTSYVAFLDADDRLLPSALEAGLACMAERPDSAFVYGGYRHISENGRPVGPDKLIRIQGDPHLSLLQGNQISMIAAVLFRRDHLLAVNGFDESLRRCEDFDLYLRIVQKYPIVSHPAIVAEYRMHQQNMSKNLINMLETVLDVFDRHEARVVATPSISEALRSGRAYNRTFYVSKMIDAASTRWRIGRDIGALKRDWIDIARWSPPRRLPVVLAHHVVTRLPRPILDLIRWLRDQWRHTAERADKHTT